MAKKEVSWKNCYNTDHMPGSPNITMARERACKAGYPYYHFMGKVYESNIFGFRRDREATFEIVGLTEDLLDFNDEIY